MSHVTEGIDEKGEPFFEVCVTDRKGPTRKLSEVPGASIRYTRTFRAPTSEKVEYVSVEGAA